jgi:hypothetical protein
MMGASWLHMDGIDEKDSVTSELLGVLPSDDKPKYGLKMERLGREGGSDGEHEQRSTGRLSDRVNSMGDSIKTFAGTPQRNISPFPWSPTGNQFRMRTRGQPGN